MKMLGALAAAAVFFMTTMAGAAVISGPQTTAGGKSVDLGGLKWLSWDQTAGFNRYDIESGVGNTFLADGWRYASRSETEALLDSLWGGTHENWHVSNFDGADWLYSTFGGFSPLAGNGTTFVNLQFGNDGECSADTSLSCYGHVVSEYGSALGTGPHHGWFHNTHGLSFGTVGGTNNNEIIFESYANGSSVLVMNDTTPVPLPGAIPLLLAGLGALGLARRRQRGS